MSNKIEHNINDNCDLPSHDFDVRNVHEKSNKSRIFAQILVGSANGLLYLSIGSTFAIIPIIIADLTSKDDIIKSTAYDLSWLGSLGAVMIAFASTGCGLLCDPVGRKKSLVFVSVPNIIAWILIWQATNIQMLYTATILFGLSDGISFVLAMTYLVEVSEPSLRGVLLTYLSLFTGIGSLVTYLLGTILPWRTAAAVIVSFPVIGAVALTMIPESPIWLVAKGHSEMAMKNLCWLRGWVKPSAVKEEFMAIVTNYKKSLKCPECSEADTPLMDIYDVTCYHKNNSENKFKSVMNVIVTVKEKDTLRPLILTLIFLFFSTMTSFESIMPSMINYFRVYNVPLDANWAMVGTSVLFLTGGLIFMALLSCFGKRIITLYGMFISASTTLCLGIYAYKYIPHNMSTYRPVEVLGEPSYIPLILFVILTLSNTIGLIPVSRTFPSEPFPYRTRVYAVGICGTMSGIFHFVAAKINIYLEDTVGIYGAFFVYTAFTYVGLIYLYFFLVETEKRKLEDIQADFTGSRNKIFADDFFIRRVKKIFCKQTSTKSRSHSLN